MEGTSDGGQLAAADNLTYQPSGLNGLTLTGGFGGTKALLFRDYPPAGDQYASAATRYELVTNANVYDFPQELARQIFMILPQPTVLIDSRRCDLLDGLVQAIH